MFKTGIAPIPRGWMSQAQRNRLNAQLAAEEEAQRAAERERAAAQPPPDDLAPETTEESPPPEEVAAAAADDGEDQTDAGAPVDAPPPPSPRDGPPPPEGEDQERNRLMGAWLREHFEIVEAMARAGEAPVRPPPAEEQAPPDSEAPPPPPPPVYVAPGDRWNKPKMAEFLRQLAATHSVTAAAKAVGMSRESAHRLRNRLKGQPFDIAWEAAFRHGYDNLAHSALELALEGEEVPHYHRGELVGTHRKRNGALIAALLKMRNQLGAPMLGRYGAAAEYWSEEWDRLLRRVETGSVDWSDEREALGQEELDRLELPSPEKDVNRIIARNLPDKRLDED